MSKHNLFDFINEKENNINETNNISTIIYKDKSFDEIGIPKLFNQIKKCKKLKDLKYYQLSEVTCQLEKPNREVFEKYISLVCKGAKSYKSSLERTLSEIDGLKIVLRRANGEKLEEIGLEKGISRERVRQIEKTALNIIYTYIYTYLQIRHLNNDFSSDLFYNYKEIFKFIKNKELIKAIEYTLLKIKDDIFSFYDNDFEMFYNNKKKNILVKTKSLIKLDNNFDYFEAYTKINNTLTFSHNVIDFTFDIYKNYLVKNGYIFKGSLATKQEILPSSVILSNVIRDEFPEGVITDEDGIKLLNEKIYEIYQTEVKLNSALANIDETSPELIIWGKKKYS